MHNNENYFREPQINARLKNKFGKTKLMAANPLEYRSITMDLLDAFFLIFSKMSISICFLNIWILYLDFLDSGFYFSTIMSFVQILWISTIVFCVNWSWS